MSNETLTPAEVATLLALMAEAREISNKELDEVHGFSLTGPRRTKLNELKLVDTRKDGRVFVHQLTRQGWARCREELVAGRPKGARGTFPGALYAVLSGLDRFLDRDELNLEYVFQRTVASVPVDQTPAPAAAAAANEPPAGKPDAALPSGDIEARVRDAYKQLASRPGALVGLAELRPLLGDAATADVDQVLKAMDRLPDVSVIPEENQKTLTRADRVAAVRIGGRDSHLIAIEQA